MPEASVAACSITSACLGLSRYSSTRTLPPQAKQACVVRTSTLDEMGLSNGHFQAHETDLRLHACPLINVRSKQANIPSSAKP